MKKIFSFLATAVAALAFTACEDVPAPYSINDGEGGTTSGFHYVSNNLMSGWSVKPVEGKLQPWSQGTSYTQATGYQKWDGADQKSNKEVEGWLISPAFNTNGVGKLKMSFDYFVRYTNNDAAWKDHCKVYLSDDYNGADVTAATWTPLEVNLVESPYSDFTTYTSGEIQIPEEFVGKENLRVAFWFYAPATGSTTWELQNFRMDEGEAGTGPVDDQKHYKFVKATTVESGKQYLIVADGKMAKPITGTATYGYLNVEPVGIKDNYIVVSGLTNAFTFNLDLTADISGNVGDAYNIIQSDGRYLWAQEGLNYKNFNVAENPEGDKAWIVSIEEGTSFRIICGNIGRFFQYSKQYTSFGCYAEEQQNALYPELYVLEGETDEEVTQPSGDTPGTGGDTPTPVTGENLLANGDFEAWTGGQPDNWKSTSSASTATLKQSTNAHEGSYSVEVVGQASSNKRLAYKEITLKAGTYVVNFYAAAATSDAASITAGFVPVTNGTVGNYNYTKGSDGKNKYYNLSASEWTQVNFTFTLSAQTTICPVVMISGNPGKNVLIDDYTLTTSDGGIVDGGTPPAGETAQFRLAQSVASGKQYLIVAETNNTYYAAKPVISGHSYDYLSSVAVTTADGIITADPANAFTFVASDNGFKIQQPDGRFLYMDETHNSFQVNAAPNEGFVWTVAIEPAAGYFKITNVARNKYVQLSTQNNNTWGSYPEAKEGGVMPRLYERVQ